MALANDKKVLMKQVLPDFELCTLAGGILVSSDRLLTPRFIPYDKAGKCPECKATEIEVDYMITKEGVTIWSSRIKGPRFVPVDMINDLPGHTFVKVIVGKKFDLNFLFRSKTRGVFSTFQTEIMNLYAATTKKFCPLIRQCNCLRHLRLRLKQFRFPRKNKKGMLKNLWTAFRPQRPFWNMHNVRANERQAQR